MGVFIDLFGKSPRVAVVEAFAENPGALLSIPNVVSYADGAVSRGAAYFHIMELVREGILAKADKKVGKCSYYGFNDADPRGKSLCYLESVLALGRVEQAIRSDRGVEPTQPFPQPDRPVITIEQKERAGKFEEYDLINPGPQKKQTEVYAIGTSVAKPMLLQTTGSASSLKVTDMNALVTA